MQLSKALALFFVIPKAKRQFHIFRVRLVNCSHAFVIGKQKQLGVSFSPRMQKQS